MRHAAAVAAAGATASVETAHGRGVCPSRSPSIIRPVPDAKLCISLSSVHYVQWSLLLRPGRLHVQWDHHIN
jgi:hypothetical protein